MPCVPVPEQDLDSTTPTKATQKLLSYIKYIIFLRLMQESGNYKTAVALIRMDPKYSSKAFNNIRNIPVTYSYVTNKLSPTLTKQTSTAINQIHTATMQKPSTTKLSPAVNVQAPTAIKQTSTATARAPFTTKQIHTTTT
ncbi:hypothetical protein DSO57_1008112 [Entomophthora muscae]|uniref:Uncharacterized protein n=1 Tax=Entomophthora muscae TaxID=34485 RepID=A0ACC2TUD2_9FUNG|nr:hypothetical protein DSO57_1008112 [Entomophthora muscae]